jgi:hypothetical protein
MMASMRDNLTECLTDQLTALWKDSLKAWLMDPHKSLAMDHQMDDVMASLVGHLKAFQMVEWMDCWIVVDWSALVDLPLACYMVMWMAAMTGSQMAPMKKHQRADMKDHCSAS